MVRVKICGITNPRDAGWAVKAGADALGFIFYKKSPRYVKPQLARAIIKSLPPFVTAVGVFVNATKQEIKNTCRLSGVSVIQLHGDETPLFCRKLKDYKIIKAFRVARELKFKSVSSYPVDAYLFDAYRKNAYGGTGHSFHWGQIKGKKFNRPVIVSGGLTINNVAQAISTLNPYAVDVSSGVESSPGVKDHRLVAHFIKLVKSV